MPQNERNYMKMKTDNSSLIAFQSQNNDSYVHLPIKIWIKTLHYFIL
jgi:hypothetical protein